MSKYSKYAEDFKRQFSEHVEDNIKSTLHSVITDIYTEKEREIEDLIVSGVLKAQKEVTAKQVFPNLVS